MNRLKILLFTLGTLLIFSFVSNAYATLILYGDRTSWDTVVTSSTTIDFDSLQGTQYETLTIDTVTFDVPERNTSSDLWVSNDGSYTGLGIALVGNYSPTSIEAIFNPETTAVAVDVFNLSVDDIITVSVMENSSLSTYSVSVDNPNYSFFGIGSDAGYISSIRSYSLFINTII